MITKYLIVWSFIPFSLFALFLWGVIGQKLGRKFREPSGFYFRQFLFTVIVLLLSEIFILSRLYEFLESSVSIILPEGFLAWIVYPALLLVGAIILPNKKEFGDLRTKNIRKSKKS